MRRARSATFSLLKPRVGIATTLLVCIGYGRAKAALRLSGGQLVARLVCQAGRRTAMHSSQPSRNSDECVIAAVSSYFVSDFT